MFASGYMIEEHHLSVFVGRNLYTFCAITRGVLVWVNIYHLSVTLVSEQ